MIDPEVGGTTVPTLRVWVDVREYSARVPLKVVATLPALAYARGQESSAIEVARPEGATQRAGPLHVELSTAALDATEYPSDGAEVALSGGSTAKLRSDGPVTGSVGPGSLLDNLLGAGACHVGAAGGATVRCN